MNLDSSVVRFSPDSIVSRFRDRPIDARERYHMGVLEFAYIGKKNHVTTGEEASQFRHCHLVRDPACVHHSLSNKVKCERYLSQS